ncbi:integrase core domain-containing protein, partial [Ramlibacter monticola]|uniref:integrase core domain-containing protein n=1 Tax=Ramlibacter monticola TaxID=1926872 RepID=UPI001F257B60
NTGGRPGERRFARSDRFDFRFFAFINTSNQDVLLRRVEFTQYCSREYQRLHARHGIACSMTDGYDCYQNAMAERVNGILKMEYLLHTPADLKQATRMVSESVRLYNQARPHLSLEYKTPDATHRESLAAQRQPATRPEQVST